MAKYDIKRRPGITYLKTFPVGEPIVSMIEFKGTLFVATTKSVFKLVDDEFYLIEFVSLPDEAPTDIGRKRHDLRTRS